MEKGVYMKCIQSCTLTCQISNGTLNESNGTLSTDYEPCVSQSLTRVFYVVGPGNPKSPTFLSPCLLEEQKRLQQQQFTDTGIKAEEKAVGKLHQGVTGNMWALQFPKDMCT